MKGHSCSGHAGMLMTHLPERAGLTQTAESVDPGNRQYTGLEQTDILHNYMLFNLSCNPLEKRKLSTHNNNILMYINFI